MVISEKLLKIFIQVAEDFPEFKVLLDSMMSTDNIWEKDYLDISSENPNQASYFPVTKLAKTENPMLDTKLRIRTSYGRLLTYFNANVKLSNKSIETISNFILAKIAEKSVEIKVVSGEDIYWYYNEDNYNCSMRNTDELHNSCMRYSTKSSFLQLYAINPNKISLVVVLVHGQVAARALLWKTYSNSEIYQLGSDLEDVTLIDRIYFNNRIYLTMLINWAKESGIKFCYQTNKRYSIELVWNYRGNVPYLDTFSWGEIRHNRQYNLSAVERFLDTPDHEQYLTTLVLHNFKPDTSNPIIKLTSDSGHYNTYEGTCNCCHGKNIPIYLTPFDGAICSSCYIVADGIPSAKYNIYKDKKGKIRNQLYSLYKLHAQIDEYQSRISENS